VKTHRCREAYDYLRVLFHEICGNMVDAGNALWFGLDMYAISAVFMFLLALELSRVAVDEDEVVTSEHRAHHTPHATADAAADADLTRH